MIPEDMGEESRIILKHLLNLHLHYKKVNIIWMKRHSGRGMDSSVSGQGSLVTSIKHGNEPSRFIKRRRISLPVDRLSTPLPS